MDLRQWQTKPDWEHYEGELVARGYWPYWDGELEARINTIGITCALCGAKPSYIGMTNGAVELGFVACQRQCGQWFWFQAPSRQTQS